MNNLMSYCGLVAAKNKCFWQIFTCTYSEFCGSDNRTQTAKYDYCTQPVNLAGVPAASIPVKLSKKSLPLAMQVIGPFGQDMKVIGFCKWLENLVHFPQPELLT